MKRILGVSSLSGTHSLKATVVHDVVEKLKLNSGDKIVFIEENGKITIEKA
jgi:hypothetical protein